MKLLICLEHKQQIYFMVVEPQLDIQVLHLQEMVLVGQQDQTYQDLFIMDVFVQELQQQEYQLVEQIHQVIKF